MCSFKLLQNHILWALAKSNIRVIRSTFAWSFTFIGVQYCTPSDQSPPGWEDLLASIIFILWVSSQQFPCPVKDNLGLQFPGVYRIPWVMGMPTLVRLSIWCWRGVKNMLDGETMWDSTLSPDLSGRYALLSLIRPVLSITIGFGREPFNINEDLGYQLSPCWKPMWQLIDC